MVVQLPVMSTKFSGSPIINSPCFDYAQLSGCNLRNNRDCCWLPGKLLLSVLAGGPLSSVMIEIGLTRYRLQLPVNVEAPSGRHPPGIAYKSLAHELNASFWHEFPRVSWANLVVTWFLVSTFRTPAWICPRDHPYHSLAPLTNGNGLEYLEIPELDISSAPYLAGPPTLC